MCLLLNYIVDYLDYISVFLEMHVNTKFHLDWLLLSVNYMPIYVAIIMYGKRLSIVVLQEQQCLQCCLYVDIINAIGSHHFTKFCSFMPSGF